MSARRALLVLLLALGCRPAIPFAERAFFTREAQALPAAEDCERCHQEVYREWQDSGHAHAFERESFQAATHRGRARPTAADDPVLVVETAASPGRYRGLSALRLVVDGTPVCRPTKPAAIMMGATTSCMGVW